ncbi:succinylglutamate desuccinylase [Allopusillimonas ginsengisoli]|nr:succinylglutamate desuccinylase [Allopusillimonas ginsengisoli]
MSNKSRIWTRIDFNADGKHNDYLWVSHSSNSSAYGCILVPVICIRNGDGPTALLTAGNHGDEYEGQVALIRLARELNPEDVRGRVIIIPALNFPAVDAGRRVSPIDNGNLNRVFPGLANGTPTEMIAHYVDSVLFPQCDLVIDLHSGGRSLEYTPCALARHSPDPEHSRRVSDLLEVFGAPVSILTDGAGGGAATTLYAAASARGIPAITTELGGGATLTQPGLTIAEQGTRRVLKHYGITPDGQADLGAPLRLFNSGGPGRAIYATERGLFEPIAAVGQDVSAGQLAGYIHSHEKPLQAPIRLCFPADGMVSCRRFPTLTMPGDCLFNLANAL